MILINKEWREINGYPNYLVSNYGEVFSKNVNRLLRQSTTKPENGYKLAWLTKNNKTKGFLVHRLVYETFIEAVPPGMQINHKDENKYNNRLDNLEIVTPSENLKYGTGLERRIRTRRKTQGSLWSAQLRKPCINETTGTIYPSLSEAARQTNGKVNSIGNACAKRRKTYKNEVWSYYERGIN